MSKKKSIAPGKDELTERLTAMRDTLASTLAEPIQAAAPAGAPWGFNTSQLATYEQARSLRVYLNANHIGRGIPMGDDESGPTLAPENPNYPWLPRKVIETGIYLPKWEAGPGGFPAPNALGPNGEKLLYLHFLFNNGKRDVNVGLCMDRFRRYPNNTIYVLNSLSEEIGR